MDKQYGTRSREIIWARKRKWDLPQKMQIHPTMNNEVNKSKIHHSTHNNKDHRKHEGLCASSRENALWTQPTT